MDFSSFFDYNANPANSHDAAALIFLPKLSTEEWDQILSVAQRRAVQAGAVVVAQGESSRTFFIVASGKLEVVIRLSDGSERIISEITPLSIFGEQAFFDGLPRSASIRAKTAAEFYEISFDRFEILTARHPELARTVLFDLGRIVSLRLREMNELFIQGR